MSGPPPYDAGSQPPPQDQPYPPPGGNGPYGPQGQPQDRPYQQPYQQQAPYYGAGYPNTNYGYGYSREHPQGTTILILGICGLVACQLLGPVAWVMGNNAIREIDANPYAYSNRSSVQAGRICGIIATVLTVLWVLFMVLLFVPLALTGSS
jgi:hypothetical protein